MISKRMKNRAGFVLLFLCLVNSIIGQDFLDIAETSYRILPTHYVDFKNAKVNININNTSFRLPLHSEKKTNTYIGGNYRLLSVQTDAFSDVEHNRLSCIRLDVGAVYKRNETQSVRVLVRPSLQSDLQDLSLADWQIGAQLQYKNKHSSGATSWWGLEYRRTAYGNLILPIVGYAARISEKISYKLNFPYNAEFRYAASPRKLFFGCSADYLQESFRLSDFTGKQYVRTDQVFAFLFAEYMLFAEVVAWAKAGLPVVNQYGIFEKDATYTDFVYGNMPSKKNAEPYHQDFAKAITFEFGIAYRLWAEE